MKADQIVTLVVCWILACIIVANLLTLAFGPLI